METAGNGWPIFCTFHNHNDYDFPFLFEHAQLWRAGGLVSWTGQTIYHRYWPIIGRNRPGSPLSSLLRNFLGPTYTNVCPGCLVQTERLFGSQAFFLSQICLFRPLRLPVSVFFGYLSAYLSACLPITFTNLWYPITVLVDFIDRILGISIGILFAIINISIYPTGKAAGKLTYIAILYSYCII